jgi:hypothetical protein
MSGTELIRYDAMCSAIAAAYQVDEVKDIRDKALAIEIYARQARNTEAETRACEIRLRAERRCEQLLREREMAKAGRPPDNWSHDATDFRGAAPLADLGISKTQSSRWQKLAAIPEEDFEATFANGAKPTTAGLIAAHEAPKASAGPVDQNALWIWGRLLNFERLGLLADDPNDLFETMLEHMQETVLELAPVVIQWLERLKTHANT